MGKSSGGGSSESIKGPRSASTPEELTKVGTVFSHSLGRMEWEVLYGGDKGESGDNERERHSRARQGKIRYFEVFIGGCRSAHSLSWC